MMIITSRCWERALDGLIKAAVAARNRGRTCEQTIL